MKQKAILIAVLLLLTAVLYAATSGVFDFSKGAYSDQPLPELVDYNFHIKPILSDNCYTCHGPDANKRKAGLRLDVEEMAFAELAENPGAHALVAGKPGKSQAYQRIISDDPKVKMPPPSSNLTLTAHEKKLIKKWISQGAKYEKHWAFISPQKSQPPEVTTAAWVQNEIDAFVLKKLEDNKILPSEKAKKEILLRRIALDITGLPPKPAQTEKFLSDNSDSAIEGIIDAFLKSPAYGERMTQMWLDVARYADSHGYQDDSYRTMWPWRDWVIHAFNKNMPYDEFLTLQLAGDLLPNATLDQILATGFNRNHPITQEGGVIQEEYLSNYVVDRTNTLGKGILGITLECAKCHDHKYDPISQKEYYGIYAFFNNVNEKGLQMDAVQAAREKYFADHPYINITDKEVKGVLSFVNKNAGDVVKVMVMNDSTPRQTHVLNRGNYDDPTDSVMTATPINIYPFSPDLPKNRLGLAQWVTSSENPLTARVFVNRIWGMLFGNGLVETSEDFGVQGSLPSHPQLLDWLSRDFMENNWDIKYLIKKIMLSATYQQSSKLRPELKQSDPNNRLLARAQRFRMSGEMIRDYFLATSGLLNDQIGGESVKPYQPEGLWEETNAGGNRGVLTTYVEDEGEKLYRRSLYTFWKRTLPPPSMSIFDAPTRDFCEVRRQKTNTPLQALALQNDTQMLEAARFLAQQTLLNYSDDKTILEHLFQQILARPPQNEELGVIRSYFDAALASYKDKAEAAEKLLAVGASEVLETDPVRAAALMLTAQVIYNLDETITKE